MRMLVAALLLLGVSAAAPSVPLPAPVPAGGVVRGDVDGDGTIAALDALATLTHVVGRAIPSDWSVDPQGDGNCDGQITAFDALLILSYAVGKDVSSFCVGDPLATSLTLTPDSSLIRVSDTLRVVADARDAGGGSVTGLPLEWSLSDSAVAEVDSTGLVRGTAPGTTWVRARTGSLVDSVRVDVVLFLAGRQTVQIQLPAGVPSTGLVVRTPNDSVPAADLLNIPVNLATDLISTIGVLDANQNPILLGPALYPPDGDTVSISTLSTATSLVLMNPFVAAVLYFDPAGDKNYASTIAALPETQTLANLIAQKLPANPGILTAMDAEVQTAVHNASMAFLNTLGSLPTKSDAVPTGEGPARVVASGPDSAQSGVIITRTPFDSAGTRYLRLDVTNQRRRYVYLVVEDSTGRKFGTPESYFIPPANDLISFQPLKDSKSRSVLDLRAVSDSAAGRKVKVKVYGPGISGFPPTGEGSRLVSPIVATAMTQFIAPVVSELLGAPSACVIALQNNMFAATLGDVALTASVEQKAKNGEYVSAILEILGSFLSKIVDVDVLTNALAGCGASAAQAAVMAGNAASYAAPVAGQVRLAVSAFNVSVVAVPTLADIAMSDARSTWDIWNSLNVSLETSSIDGLTARFRTVCTSDTGDTVSCGTLAYDYGDGTTATVTADSATHTYARSGKYTVRVTATDVDAARADTTLDVWVATPVRGAVAFIGCPPEDNNCNNGTYLFFYDLLADTVTQIYQWSSSDPTQPARSMSLSHDGAMVAWMASDYSYHMLFVPQPDAPTKLNLPRLDECDAVEMNTCVRQPITFGYDRNLYAVGGRYRIEGTNTVLGELLLRISPSAAAPYTELVDLVKESSTRGVAQCLPTWLEMAPYYPDGTWLTMQTATWLPAPTDPDDLWWRNGIWGPCELSTSTRSGASRFDTGWRGQPYQKVFRTKGGGYVSYLSANPPPLWNADGTVEQQVRSLSDYYFDMAYNWDEDVILIAEGFFGITVVKATDLTDKQRRLSGYRVNEVYTSPYPSGR